MVDRNGGVRISLPSLPDGRQLGRWSRKEKIPALLAQLCREWEISKSSVHYLGWIDWNRLSHPRRTSLRTDPQGKPVGHLYLHSTSSAITWIIFQFHTINFSDP